MNYWVQLATEQFPPSELVEQAIEAERAGFDAVNVSDHFQPWWEPGHSGQAWTLLGAICHATERVGVGTGVTAPVYRYNPAVVAQFAATVEELSPGRGFLGDRLRRGAQRGPLRDGLARHRPAGPADGGGARDHRPAPRRPARRPPGEYFRTRGAYLHTRGERRPPVYVSAFGPDAAGVAARHGDGLWTLADPESAPDLIDAYRSACDDAGREPGEIILQTGFSWAEDDDAALEGARVWKATQPQEYFTDDWHDPKAMFDKADREVSDEEFAQSYIVGSDPEHHVERIRQVEQLGATVVCLQNGSGADPLGALRTYGERILPALKSARVV